MALVQMQKVVEWRNESVFVLFRQISQKLPDHDK